MQLRDYQESISTDAAKMLQWLKIVYLSMQPRTGKTLTALVAADKFGAKSVLFLTKKKAISSIKSDYDKLGPSFNLICTNYEQIYTLSPDYHFDLVILDEAHSCFAAGTEVDGRNIENIKPGDTVKSFNIEKNIIEDKEVLFVHKMPINKKLLIIKIDGRDIICTADHRFYTRRGWVKAEDLSTDDELYCLW